MRRELLLFAGFFAGLILSATVVPLLAQDPVVVDPVVVNPKIGANW